MIRKSRIDFVNIRSSYILILRINKYILRKVNSRERENRDFLSAKDSIAFCTSQYLFAKSPQTLLTDLQKSLYQAPLNKILISPNHLLISLLRSLILTKVLSSTQLSSHIPFYLLSPLSPSHYLSIMSIMIFTFSIRRTRYACVPADKFC